MRALILPLVLFLAQPALAQRQSFVPRDEALANTDVLALRDRLRAAVAARDVDGLAAAACPDLSLSDDGPGGPDELRQMLTPSGTNPQSAVDNRWQVLAETLAAPGYFDAEGEFWMPYHWRIQLPARIDPTQAFFVNGENVNLRQAPDRSGDILTRVSFEVVLAAGFDPEAEYRAVILSDSTRGYLHRDYLTPMSGARAALVRSPEGIWQLCTFTTGR